MQNAECRMQNDILKMQNSEFRMQNEIVYREERMLLINSGR